MFKRLLHSLSIANTLLALASTLILVSCASSNVSREVSSNIDMGMRNGTRLVDSFTEGDIADSYQNSSQMSKGALLGGLAGGVTGALSSGIGVFEGTAIGAILGASYGMYIDSNTTFNDRLENRGITIVVLGDQILIVVPSDRLFYADTSQVKPQAYSTLNLISKYINHFTKMAVKISAYTADTGSAQLTRALSQNQANAILRYLTALGIDARLLYATGEGCSHLVVANTKAWESDNYRIEIRLQKLFV